MDEQGIIDLYDKWQEADEDSKAILVEEVEQIGPDLWAICDDLENAKYLIVKDGEIKSLMSWESCRGTHDMVGLMGPCEDHHVNFSGYTDVEEEKLEEQAIEGRLTQEDYNTITRAFLEGRLGECENIKDVVEELGII